MTALHWAADGEHTKVVELLLAAGADVNAKSARGLTALSFASGHGHHEIVEAAY